MLENLKNKRLFILLLLPLTALFLSIYIERAFATSETINFQGRIVRNDSGYEGLNVTAGSPACVVAGASNDTCDFKIKYYNATSAGTLLGTETFNNVEIGYYQGVFNLPLGTGSYTPGSETSFRDIFLNNPSVYVQTEFAPDGSTFTETFLDSGGLRIGVRASAYAISSSGANKQFQFDVANDATGYSSVSEGQLFFDGDDNVLRIYDGSNWLAIQAYNGDLPSLWTLNTTPTPDVISSYTGLDVAFGGDDSSAPLFYDVSAQLLTLTNNTAGNSFVVNDSLSDTTPFVIDATGNVGIGTSTPGTKLVVEGGRTTLKASSEEYTLGIGRTDGAGLYWLGVDASATPTLKIKNTGGDDRILVTDGGLFSQISSNSTESGIVIKRPTTDATHIQWQLFGQTNNKDFWITAFDGSSTKNYIKFLWDTNVTNFDAGNVGIGVASPEAFFDIKAATTTYAQLNLTTSAGVNPATPTNGDLWWNGTNLYFYDGSSNVDILAGGSGTGSLFTDGGAVTFLTSTTDDFALGGTDSTSPFFFDEGAELLALTNTTAGLSFKVNDEASDTTPFVIDASGNVGIGTSTPGAKLDIAGATSTISNSSGDISIDSASGNISFSGDSLTSVLNATFSGDVTLNGSQLKLGNHASNPTSIGEGALVYNSTDKKLYYYKDTGWTEVGNVYSGSANQTLRHNGTTWVASSALINDGTDVTATGQVRVGNYSSKPTGIGAGALVYDTVLGGLFVYDGADWKAISTSQLLSTSGTVSDGSYLQLAHNLNTFDVMATAWVKDGTQWKVAGENWNNVLQNLDNELNPDFRSKYKVDSISIKSKDDNLGNGIDGTPSTITTSKNINTTNMISGRTCSQGGDAVNYQVTALGTNYADVSLSPDSACLTSGDEVLLINLAGTLSSDFNPNYGNYETFRISSISGNRVYFTSNKTRFYGDGVYDDTNIGTTDGTQRVMLQRVPNYVNLTINSGGTLTVSAFDNSKGGVLFFRATGTVTVNSGGYISATGLGWEGGERQGLTARGGYGGGSYCAESAVFTYSSGGAQGGTFNVDGYTNNLCGGGGGGGVQNTTIHYKSVGVGSYGGAGGGGGGAYSASSTMYGGGGGGGGSTGGAGTGGGGGNGSGNGSNGTTAGVNGDGGDSVAYYGGGGGGGGRTILNGDYGKRIIFGSGGGAGGDGMSSNTNRPAGVGGQGGGSIYIAANSLSIGASGAVQATGGTGGSGSLGGGGGGGGGGDVKIYVGTVSLGTTGINAAGGTGGTGGHTGGTGGDGRVLVTYSTSISGTTNPTYTSATYTLNYYTYGIYTSEEIQIPEATSIGNISWTESIPSGTNVVVQTRTGSTEDSRDGTWEAWKPSTVSTNYTVMESMDTHSNWTGTNVTVADGDITRNVDYFEDEDESSAGNITKFTATAANGYANAAITSIDLTGYTHISAWVYSSVAGNNVKLGFGESAGTEQEETVTIDSANTWQKVYWDLGDLGASSCAGPSTCNAVDNFRITVTTNGSIVYVDNLKAEKAILTTPAGSTITSTASAYIQYRFILTSTANAELTSTRPSVSDIQIGYTNPNDTYTIDANSLTRVDDGQYYSSTRVDVKYHQQTINKDIGISKALTSVSTNNLLDKGTGRDGALSVTSTTNLNTDASNGRTCADAMYYAVTALGSNYADLYGNNDITGCLATGDEVLIMNLWAPSGFQEAPNLGNYETLRIKEISSRRVYFTTNKTKFYGEKKDSDLGVGVYATNQRVTLQRVPNYTDVTVGAAATLTVNAFDTIESGVLYFRATGTVSVASTGTITATGLGWYGGNRYTAKDGGKGGMSYCADRAVAPTFGAGAQGGNYDQGGEENALCGGGGGGGSNSLLTSSTRSGSLGGGIYGGAGGGGGGGTYASGTVYGGGGGGGGGIGGAGNGGVGGNSGQSGKKNGESGTGGSSVGAYAGGGGGGGKLTLNSVGNDLSKLYFGSGGGAGGDGSDAGTNKISGLGGRGGGVILISADTITVSGATGIQSNGEAGSSGTDSIAGGGGGGAGGSIKLVADTVSLGSLGVTVSGGAGGTSTQSGGAGGYGLISVHYVTNVTGTASPTYSSFAINGLNYSVFVSDEIATPKATNYSFIKWNANLNGFGNVQIQTRTGKSNNSTDGSWESWKPSTTDTNKVLLNDANTHTNWTGTNATVADGDVTRNIDFFEDEDESTVGNTTKITSSTDGGYADATVTSTNLSNYDYLTFWIRASQPGTTIKFGFGESLATENEQIVSISNKGIWQKVYYDITDIPINEKDGVTKLRITNLTSNSNIVYLDNIYGERMLRSGAGSVVTSTPSDYFQYRVILTSTNPTVFPELFNVSFNWSSGYKLVNIDEDTTRLYNYSGQTQDLRITLTTSGGTSALGSGWTETGGDIYRATGKVGIGDATPDTTLKVVGSLCVKSDANNCAGSTAGTIYANNTSLQSADLAEMYKVSDESISNGDLVSLSVESGREIEKSNIGNQNTLMGVVSTTPGLIMNDSNRDGYRPVALVGRVPVKVVNGSISIKRGDPITVSPLESFGAKAVNVGFTVAKSLEDTISWNNQTCPEVESIEKIEWPQDKGNNENHPCFSVPLDSMDKETRESLMKRFTLGDNDNVYVGKIMAYVSVSWYQPEWMTKDLAEVVQNYQSTQDGLGSWKKDGDKLITLSDLYANSMNGNYGNFGILSGGILNIGDSKFTVDTGGNVSVAGDMLISGSLSGGDGGLIVSLGDSVGEKMFEIKNSNGQTVFSVDSTGEVGGTGIYKTGWIKVSKDSFVDVNHNFGKSPSDISIIVSSNEDGTNFTTKGVGTDYYFDSTSNDSLRVYNKTDKDVFVKITVAR